MAGIEALRQTLGDIWEESFLIILSGLLGALLSLLIIPIPFVLGAHYQMALRLSEKRVTSLRSWLSLGRQHWRFFLFWSVSALGIAIVLVGNAIFYLGLEAEWVWIVGYIFLGLLLTWLLPQPFVPAFYLRQEDRRLRTALRNTAVLLVHEPFSMIMLWAGLALLALPLAYFAWPLLPALIPVMALISTHVVKRYVRTDNHEH